MRRTFAALLLLALALALPAAAGAAKTRTVHEDAQTLAAIEGEGTNGFHFILFTFDRGVVLSFYGRAVNHGGSSVSYYATGRKELGGLDHGDLDIKVGNRGHFRGHFVTKSTKVEKPPKGCTGDPTTTEEGYFEGSFVFHGERGFTTVQAPRATSSLSHGGATDCQVRRGPRRHAKNSKKSEERAEKAAERDEFRLLAADRKADLIFQASREQSPPEADGPTLTSFDVTADGGSVGAFHVYRSAFLFDIRPDAASSFLTPNLEEPLAEAVIEPPAPFSGSATFHLEGPKKASWTGDLAVELPGAGTVPLTGKNLYAGTCRGQTDCTDTLPGPLKDMLEGGIRGDSSGFVTTEAQTIY